ncbi:MAG: cupin domain-containing protein [Candidatus Eremiobacteraeota bacterium]|nr:cupin domain-containing protein [Candidatus Eremiobacteraeota bacterium]
MKADVSRSTGRALEHKRKAAPDETRSFSKGRLDVFNIGGTSVGIATFEPGWKWSECVKPVAKTKSCEVGHLGYVVSGRMHVVMDDGTEDDFGPGDLMSLKPGHDAWIVGNQTCEIVDFLGAGSYAKS